MPDSKELTLGPPLEFPISLMDQSDRDQAINNREQNMVVLAGAGTGKTSILINRMTCLIVCEGIPVEKMVALTFTKKAGEEMRVRLENNLKKLLISPDELEILLNGSSINAEEGQKRTELAFQNLPKAQIGTIHSFAAFLLRLYPLQAKVDPQFKEDEGEIQNEIFNQIWTQFLEGELQENASRSHLWTEILGPVQIQDLKELAQGILIEELDLGAMKNPADLKGEIQVHSKSLEKILKQYPLSAKAPRFNEGVDCLRRVFQWVNEDKPIAEEIRELLKNIKWKTPPTTWKIPDPEREKLLSIAKIGIMLCDLNEPLVQKSLKIVEPVIYRVKKELARRGILSFQQLLLLARNLLRDYPLVRQELKNKFETILVDEFQDTDPLQGEIVVYLAEEKESQAPEWSKVRLEPGKLFVVGDPKQSIYRFRGADMAAFDVVHQFILKQGGLEIHLQSNFRSDAHIIHAVNHVFDPLMQQKQFIQPPYVELVPVRPARPGGGLQISFIEEDNEWEIKAEDVRYQEAEIIAESILKAVNDPQAELKRSFKDFALLFRSSNAFAPYLEVFKNKGIPYLAEGEKYFYRTPEINDFLNIASVIINPKDKLALVGVLRSAAGGLTDDEIWQLKMADGLDILKSPPLLKNKLNTIFHLLNSIHKKVPLWPTRIIIDEILNQFGLIPITASATHGEQGVANLKKILALADKWTKNESLTFESFIERFRNNQRDEKDEGENPLADSQFDAVKVMTIHKSKGLEFPVVYLPNISAGTRPAAVSKPLYLRDWRSGQIGIRLRNSSIVNNAMVQLQDMGEEKDAAEEVRIFYVAATRARDQLVMMIRENPHPQAEFIQMLKKSGSFPQNAMETIETEKGPIPIDRTKWKKTEFFRHAPKTSKREEKGKGHTMAELNLSRKKTWDTLNSSSLVISPTSVVRETDKIRIEDDPVPSSSRAIRMGLICHKVMELWDFKIKATKNFLHIKIAEAAHSFDLDPTHPDTISELNESHKIMDVFLGSPVYEKLQNSKIIGREVPFFYALNTKKGESEKPQLMRGIIDLIYENNGQLVIADYKTTRIDKTNLTPWVQKYAAQGEAYQEALKTVLGQKPQFELIFLRDGISATL